MEKIPVHPLTRGLQGDKLYFVYVCILVCRILSRGMDGMRLQQIRKTVYIAAVLLVLCLILLVSASYAWFSMSRAPEVNGIDTNIASNGSLEIALLSDTTFMEPSRIRTMVGSSAVVQETTEANLYWGNIVDLGDVRYGLNEISLLPARLNVKAGRNGLSVIGSNMLMIPNYGVDGRTGEFMADTVSAVYGEDGFTYFSNHQDYGVRGIGTISNMNVQQVALAGARSLVKSYLSAAKSAAVTAWQTNGGTLFQMYQKRYMLGEEQFEGADVEAIRAMADGALTALNYLDSALRQGIVGYGAAMIDDTDGFNTMRSLVENSAVPLSMVLNYVPATLPRGFSDWVSTVESNQTAMKRVIAECDSLAGNSCTASQIFPILNRLLIPEEMYLNDERLSDMDASAQIISDNSLLLSSNAGVMAVIADFTGNYSTFFSYSETVSIEVMTASSEEPAHLTRIADILDECEATAGEGAVVEAKLNDIYGYAIDLAFRCNATSDLLLQTAPALRFEENAEFVQTQGGGSYMQFESESLDEYGMALVMDAIRIAFLDNENVLLGVAKLSSSNYEVTEEGVTAPLYLYDYTISEGGSILVGERRNEECAIASLSKNTPTIVTAVVWLDGDFADNSLSSSNTTHSISGVLNLQFASSADLYASEQQIESKN